jgi:flagellar protein FliS
MAPNQALSSYQKTAVGTADPLRLIILCYETSIRDLQEAKELHANRSMDAAYEKIRHAQNIITELQLNLDYEKGGEIAVNLSRLYNFIIRELIVINSCKDASVYDHPIQILSELKEAWDGIRAGAPGTHPGEAQQNGRGWQASA